VELFGKPALSSANLICEVLLLNKAGDNSAREARGGSAGNQPNQRRKPKSRAH